MQALPTTDLLYLNKGLSEILTLGDKPPRNSEPRKMERMKKKIENLQYWNLKQEIKHIRSYGDMWEGNENPQPSISESDTFEFPTRGRELWLVMQLYNMYVQ